MKRMLSRLLIVVTDPLSAGPASAAASQVEALFPAGKHVDAERALLGFPAESRPGGAK